MLVYIYDKLYTRTNFAVFRDCCVTSELLTLQDVLGFLEKAASSKGLETSLR